MSDVDYGGALQGIEEAVDRLTDAVKGRQLLVTNNLPNATPWADAAVIDSIANLMRGTEWNADTTTAIADLIGEVRPHPGLVDPNVLGPDRTTVAAAIEAWEQQGPTSMTVALMADALYGVATVVSDGQ